LVLIVLVIPLVLFSRPLFHVISTVVSDRDEREPLADGVIDDASRLNQGVTMDIRLLEPDLTEEQLALILSEARRSGLRVSLAGSRHSMGGHTLYPGGISIDMSRWNRMQVDPTGEVLTVQSGAKWHDVLAYLDKLQRSVAIMQSNDSFSVGGSLSVNCHGWQYGKPPIASSVLSIRVMLADGSVLRCSRNENPELFSLVLGGYGLFGIILDAELMTVPNEKYRLEQHVVSTEDAFETFDATLLQDPDLQMVYARMNVSNERFLDELILNGFVSEPGIPQQLDTIDDEGRFEQILRGAKRAVFRGSGGSEYGKRLRWAAETRAAPALLGTMYTRNQLLDEGVETLENRSAVTTDILHEYFVPREEAGVFLDSVRRIVRDHEGELLNVTIRQINVDEDTFLRYADQPMIAFVMLFLQERTEAGEASMASMTTRLIEASLGSNGRYYLPYRLHATPEQFRRAYPNHQAFFDLKRFYDPDELFQNAFYVKYGRQGS
jgi:FAD/FMN-containing dehydrogenase